MACSTTPACVLVEQMIKKRPGLYNPINKKYKVVFWEEFQQNPEQYANQIDAICGVYSEKIPMKHGKDESFFRKMPNLKVVFSIGAGTDHLDLPMLQGKGIRVATTGHFNACCTAELGFALMLATARNLKPAMNAYQDGLDLDASRTKYRGARLSGSKLGIVGMGTIGYIVAERAAAFKMKVLYHNRHRRSDKDETLVQATYCDTLEKLLVQSDFVMLCVPLNDGTRDLIGAKELSLMKSTAKIINIARGELVDQDALTMALQDKVIAGAAMDVTTPEPLPPNHPLLLMPNVIVTPHYAGTTNDSKREMPQIVLANLTAGLEGKPMPQEINSKE